MTMRGTQRWLVRIGWGPEHEMWMMLSAVLALCVLVVVAALVLPLFGPRVAAISAVGAVGAILVICYLICVPQALSTTAYGRCGRTGPGERT